MRGGPRVRHPVSLRAREPSLCLEPRWRSRGDLLDFRFAHPTRPSDVQELTCKTRNLRVASASAVRTSVPPLTEEGCKRASVVAPRWDCAARARMHTEGNLGLVVGLRVCRPAARHRAPHVGRRRLRRPERGASSFHRTVAWPIHLPGRAGATGVEPKGSSGSRP